MEILKKKNNMDKIKSIVEKNRKSITWIAFSLILVIALFSRLYKIGSIPYGMHIDEAGMGYDAFCLATNGTDRWLNRYPVYLINFGRGQSALLAYLASIFVRIVGLNTISIRIPTLILSVMAIIEAYFLVNKEKGNRQALLYMFLITIMPWHIMASRWGLDCNLLAPMLMTSVFALMNAKNYKGYILAGITFGITLYSYALSYLILPIFLFIQLIYMLRTEKIKFKQIIVLGIPIFCLAIPLFLMILVNKGVIGEIHSFISICKLPKFAGSEISLLNIKENLSYYKTIFTHDLMEYNATSKWGTVYLILVPFIVFGFFIELSNFITNIKNKKFDIGSVFLIQFIAVYSVMLIIKEPNIDKGNALFMPLIYFAVPALKVLHDNYKISFYAVMLITLLCFIKFELYYFGDFSKDTRYVSMFETDYVDAIRYVVENDEYDDNDVYVFSNSIETYIYPLFIEKTSPQYFNETYVKGDNPFNSYGRYKFFDSSYNDNAVYIVLFNDEWVNEMCEKGFKIDNKFVSGTYRVLYK